MKNTLVDLNNHLFAQIERLNDESLTEPELELEMRKSEAMAKVATTIISNANLALRAKQFQEEYRKASVPEMLENKVAK